MPAPGDPFFGTQLVAGGSQLVVAGPAVLEHLQANNSDPNTFFWLQLFDAAAAPPDGTAPAFVFPVAPQNALFWTPPTAAAGGLPVIGWRVVNGVAIAISSTPATLTQIATGILQWWAWGRGTEAP